MDYEKKYNEAMLRADEAVQKGCLDKDMFDIIFPPEESEDERIRKAICHVLNNADYGIIDQTDYTVSEMEAYLEKQKEQKPSETPSASVIYTEQGEVLAEHKPAEWSEEDEEMLGCVMDDVREARRTCTRDYDRELCDKEMDWLNNRLKSLRPTKDCNGCSKHLEGYISGRSDAENKLLDMYGILLMPDEELRMKPRWKPSEEQMEALESATENCAYSEYQDCLRELIKQLKNL